MTSQNPKPLHETQECPAITEKDLQPAIRDIRSGGRTDPGRVRSSNQDQFVVASLCRALRVLHSSVEQQDIRFSAPAGYLFLVADGVGGHSGGERASALAVNSVERFLVGSLDWCGHLTGDPSNPLLQEFQEAIRRTDARLFSEVRQRPELRGMGTTATLGYLTGDDLYIAHVGDSRCYLLRKGLLYRITNDHTLVGEMVRQGYLKPEEAAKHALRHVITNVVGGSDPGVRVELHKLTLEPQDRLLFCSDGLTEMVNEEEILAILQQQGEPEKIAHQLVDRANEKGGKDNVTAVVVHLD